MTGETDSSSLSALYMGQTANERTEHGVAGPVASDEAFDRDVSFPISFSTSTLRKMMKEAIEEEEGVQVGGHVVQAVRFAEDQAQ